MSHLVTCLNLKHQQARSPRSKILILSIVTCIPVCNSTVSSGHFKYRIFCRMEHSSVDHQVTSFSTEQHLFCNKNWSLVMINWTAFCHDTMTFCKFIQSHTNKKGRIKHAHKEPCDFHVEPECLLSQRVSCRRLQSAFQEKTEPNSPPLSNLDIFSLKFDPKYNSNVV